MVAYLTRRCLLMLPTLVGVSVIMFGLTQVMPGGPIDRMIQQLTFGSGEYSSSHHQGTELLRQELEQLYGYDRPPLERYLRWMGGLLRGDFGRSFEYDEPVLAVVRSKLPVSITFGILAFVFVFLLSIPLGIAKAVKNGSTFDVVSSLVLFFAYSIPPFALAIGLILVFSGGSFFAWFPLSGLTGDDFDQLSAWGKLLDYLHHICLPVVAYVMAQFALTAVLMKNSYLDQHQKDYVRTARAKGAKEQHVIFGHVLKNSLIPIATQLSEFPAFFIAGSVLIEQIFSLDGIGLLTYESILARDYPVMLAIIMLGALAQVAGVLLADILYALLDPRISYQKSV